MLEGGRGRPHSNQMNNVRPEVEEYMRGLAARYDEPVLMEMEALAAEKGFPIIGRLCGIVLELQARAVGARRVFELGSGFGYSGYWFARAVGEGGEIHLTDGDPENEVKARDFLSRAGVWDRFTFHVGDAVTSFSKVDGEFDVVYCDINKDGYPDAWRAARDRVRVGGLYMCDNVLWSGRVAEPDPDEWTKAIVEHNRLVSEDPGYMSTIVPTRDGVMVAMRLR